MSESTSEKHLFQAEIRQLLDLVVHSLYTDKEIFLRELISNASDSMEKFRHTEAIEKHLHQPELPLEIRITTDADARTLTIEDHGIGMTHDELISHLGTIAHSGTKQFLQAAKEQGTNPQNMIGQFGVGFYSAFMVADRVSVFSRSWRPDAAGHVWHSDGVSGYEIEEAPDAGRGVRIVLHLKEGCEEYAEEYRIKHLVQTYSNFVGFPIFLNGNRVNEVEALWLKNKSEVTDDQYKAFYQFTCKAFDEPTYRLHYSADGKLSLHSLLFVPKENPERLGFGKVDGGVALYCRKVLIDPSPKRLLPEWQRFVKGVVDCADIPLNISRETMQDSQLMAQLGSMVSSRIIKWLASEAEADPAKYRTFYKSFDRYFKEGVVTDYANREAIAKLLRYETSLTAAGESCSLVDYVGRAKEGQDTIYYLAGASREQIESSPYLEAFKLRGLEVVYITDAADEYVMDSLATFDGKKLVSIRNGGVELDDHDVEGESLSPEETSSLCDFLKQQLGDTVVSVTAGKRLVDHPIIALVPADAMSAQMRQMMKAMDESFNEAVKVELEINPRHPLIRQLAQTSSSNAELAGLVAKQLLDNALISAGLLDDARETIQRMNQLMQVALAK